MRKSFILLAFIALLASCTAPKTLYTWGKYETTSYNYLKNTDDSSIEELIKNYQIIIESQKGTRGVVPPGIYADYGFLLLQGGKTDEGRKLLKKEIALYPESKIFIDRILKKIE